MRAVLLAAVLCCNAAAHAQAVVTDGVVSRAAPRTAPGLVASTDIDALVSALQRAGFTTEVKTEERQRYVLGRQDATPFQAFVSGCNASGALCSDIELYAGFSNAPRVGWERINGWNARTRFARAFLDEKGDPALQMDIGLAGGLAPDALKAALETWGAALDTYSLFLLAKVPPVGATAAPSRQPKAGAPKR